MKELTRVVVGGILADLPAEDAQRHIHHGADLQRYLELGLRANLQEVDCAEVEAAMGGLWFSLEARQRLEKLGYETIMVPPGVTLNYLIGLGELGWSRPMSWIPEKLLNRPTKPREIAYCSSDPFIPGSKGKSPEVQIVRVAEFSQEIRERCGEGVQAVIPTVTEAAYLLVKSLNRNPFGRQWSLTATMEFSSRLCHLVVGCDALGVRLGIHDELDVPVDGVSALRLIGLAYV